MAYDDTDTEAFVMDDLGSRTGDQTLRADGTVNFAVDSTTNRYTSIAGSPITHDAAGNMTGDKDGYVYFYDYENRIVKIEDDASSTVATFEYDALGRRIRKVDAVAAVTTLYYYDPDWRCLEERDGSDILQRSFIYGNYIDEVLVMTVPGSPPTDYYYLQDHLYSPAALLAVNGTVVERYEYDAYGTVHVMDASYGSRSTSSYGNPYTFTGRRLDLLDNGALEMTYYRHRYYGPYVGRFVQHDPISYVNGLNLYSYLICNPTESRDPYGLKKEGDLCQPPHPDFPNAYDQRLLAIGKSSGVANPDIIAEGMARLENFKTLTSFVSLLDLAGGIYAGKTQEAIAKYIMESLYGELSVPDSEAIAAMLVKLRGGLIEARKGYYLWVKIEYETCQRKSKCKYKWKTKNTWIPCCSKITRPYQGWDTIPGMIPVEDNLSNVYSRSDAIADALKYCAVVQKDPAHAPKIGSKSFGNLYLWEQEARAARYREADWPLPESK